MEIGECTYSTVLSVRAKKNDGKKLDDWEQKFWDDNKDICVIQEKLSDVEQEDYDILKQMLK